MLKILFYYCSIYSRAKSTSEYRNSIYFDIIVKLEPTLKSIDKIIQFILSIDKYMPVFRSCQGGMGNLDNETEKNLLYHLFQT